MRENSVFRQAVLGRLASPEQLDTVMHVTDAKGWLALVGCVLLLAVGVVWGVSGRVPSKVESSGMLLHRGGLADVVAVGSGQLMALEVDVGDFVKKGQEIAVIAQPELKGQLTSLEARLAEQKAAHGRAQAASSRDVSLRSLAASRERQNLDGAIAANEQRAQELEDKLVTQARLYEKGLVTGEALQSTRDAIRTTQISMQGMRADQQRASVDSFSAERVNEVMLSGEVMQIQDTERQIAQLREKLEKDSRVTSTYEGRVLEVRAMVGDLVAPGTPIVGLERTGEKGALDVLLYVDSRQGKLIRPGMVVQVAPSIVRTERYGMILGTVRTVENFPSTRQGMMRVLHNEQLVDSFLAETQGTPIAVRAELTPSSVTASGYKWSSGKGPDLMLTSGTRCAAFVTTRTQRPISLVFPVLDGR